MSRLTVRTGVDVALVLLLSLIGAMGFESSFGGSGYLVPTIGGLLVGTAVALLCAVLRLGAVTTTFVAIAAFFVFGSAIAVPGEAILGFLPSLSSLADLAIGAVFGWNDLLTLTTPVGAPAYIVVVPYAAGWVVGVVAITLAARWLPQKRSPVRGLVVLSAPIALYLVGILTGTHDAYLAGARGIIFAVAALVWLGWRRAPGATLGSTTGIVLRKVGGTAIVVAGAVIVGVVAGALTTPPDASRFVLRDVIVPPFDPAVFPSPLSAFRNYTKTQADDVLFTVEGLEPGETLRLATMDSYTGKLWNVSGAAVATDGSGSFDLVGENLPSAQLLTSDATSTISVTIGAYTGVWMPGVGYPTRIELDGDLGDYSDDLRYNTATGTVALTTELHEGDSFTITADLQQQLSADELANAVPADVQLPEPADVPDQVVSSGQSYLEGDQTPYEQVTALAAGLREEGYLVHGLDSDPVPSPAGHGADRLMTMFDNTYLFGDQEQYASALALMVRELGYPARVVLGFAPVVAEGADEVEVHGSDVTAWVEVAFADEGWIAFDPTPEKTNVPQDEVPKPRSEPEPQALQPPEQPPSEDDLLTDVKIDNEKNPPDAPFSIPGWVWIAGAALLVPLVLYFVPLLVIAAVKRRRARRRRTTGAADRRAAGAWDELVDSYAELGYSGPRRATRLQLASTLEAQTAVGLREFAVASNNAVFSGEDVDARQVDELWSDQRRFVDAARSTTTWWRRRVAAFRVRPRRDLVESLRRAQR